ncbi:phenylalanine--tRNA ligase subunit alpha [Candidatus Woesearchaeota archaeon]|nr:phenylalanine--tRNA ligase subunit alpha [Candidatus Woesearchaeota archaeon]
MSGGEGKDLGRIVSSLHPLERKVLPFVGKHNDVRSLVAASGLSETEVSRAVGWLSSKGLVESKESSRDVVELGSNGKIYAKDLLPERRFLEALKVAGSGSASISAVKKTARLSDEELNICLGILKRAKAVDIRKDRELVCIITEQGRRLVSSGFAAESFIRKSFPVDVVALSAAEKSVLSELRSRKDIVRVSSVKDVQVTLSSLGREVLARGIAADVADKVTSDMLRSGSWKGKEFRRYDLLAPVSRVFGGRKQHYRRFLEDVREKFIALGFTEMTGPVVETEFWNMDALYMPQFHSARDIHQAYYVKEPKYSKSLPKDVVMKVKAAHETGVSESRGWRYSFDVQRTHRHVLRSQDTSISPRTLASPELKVPGKYFQMVRCFRYDVIDATHLADFNQIGGFVVGEGINFRHLVGLLRMFAREFADADEIKVTPAYFPFTEPSAALYAKHPEIGWIELGGSGIFRPEMMHSLGVKEPVIAWGIGVERVAMFKLGLKDIRQLFSHDLSFLRNIKVV